MSILTYAAKDVADLELACAVLARYGHGVLSPVSVADTVIATKPVKTPKKAAAVEPEAPGKSVDGPAPAAESAPSPASASAAAPCNTASTTAAADSGSADLYDAARAAAKAKLQSNAAFRTRIQALISTHGVDAIGKIPADAISAFTAQVTAMGI